MRGAHLAFYIFAATACAQDSFQQDLQTGLSLVQNGQYSGALAPLSRAAAARPNSFEPNYLLGLALSAGGPDIGGHQAFASGTASAT